MPENSHKLFIFIMVSLTAHALLMFIHGQPTQYSAQPLPGQKWLSVSLSAMNSPTPVNNAKSTNRTGENHKPGSLIATHQIITRKISHESNNLKSLHAITGLIPQKDLRKPLAIKTRTRHTSPKLAIKTNTAIQQTNSENKLTKTIPVSQNKQNQVAQQEMQRNFLLGEIKNRLLRFMYYPVQARKRGWEGKVMVSFHIDRNGFFHNIRLAHTSGYALLDSAALIAIRKVNNIPLSQRGKDFIPVAFQLPVIYRLSDS